MAPLESFAEISPLDLSELRALLETATEPRVRVWAAWALGLRLGLGAHSDLAHSASGDPSPGVRRHLVVALAGLGDRTVLAALAVADPDPYVRASACRAFASIAPELSATLLLDRLQRDESVEVRRTIVEDLRWPSADGVALAELGLRDPSAEVRAAAVERVIEATRDGREWPDTLRTQALTESDPRLRLHLLKAWARRDRGQGLLRLSSILPEKEALPLLSICLGEELQFAWLDLEPLAARRVAGVDRILLRLLNSVASLDALSWLIELAVRDQAAVDWAACDTLTPLLGSLTWAQLSDADRGGLLHLCARIRSASDEAREDDDYEDAEWADVYLTALERLIPGRDALR